MAYSAVVFVGCDILYSPEFHAHLTKDESYIEHVVKALNLNGLRWCVPW